MACDALRHRGSPVPEDYSSRHSQEPNMALHCACGSLRAATSAPPPPPPDRTAHASSGLPALLDPHHPRAAERAQPTPRMRKAHVPRRNGGKPPAGFAAGVAHVRTAPPSDRAAPHHEGGGGAAPGPPEPRDRAGPRRLPCRPPQRHPGLGPASTGCPAFLQRPRGWGRA